MIAAAAALISVATWFATPQSYIFFGILHQIAFASVAGLLFLRLPPWLTLAVGVAVLAAPHFLRADAFNHSALWWIGLATENPRSNDFVPVFPWFGMVLAGMAAAGMAGRTGLMTRLSQLRFGAWARPLRLAGRHSLAFYLLHQPLLIGLVWIATQLVPPPARPVGADFDRSCRVTCGETRDEAFCIAYCECVRADLEATGDLERLSTQPSEVMQERVGQAVALCSATTETAPIEEGTP